MFDKERIFREKLDKTPRKNIERNIKEGNYGHGSDKEKVAENYLEETSPFYKRLYSLFIRYSVVIMILLTVISIVIAYLKD